MKTKTKTFSEHSIKCTCHTILPFLTKSMTSSRIWQYQTHHNESHLYTNNTLTLVFCFHYTENHITFKKHVITNIQKNAKYGVHPSKRLQGHDKKEGTEKTQKENMPSNRCLIDSKWVSKKTSDGQFRASLAARGHTQILGV